MPLSSELAGSWVLRDPGHIALQRELKCNGPCGQKLKQGDRVKKVNGKYVHWDCNRPQFEG